MEYSYLLLGWCYTLRLLLDHTILLSHWVCLLTQRCCAGKIFCFVLLLKNLVTWIMIHTVNFQAKPLLRSSRYSCMSSGMAQRSEEKFPSYYAVPICFSKLSLLQPKNLMHSPSILYRPWMFLSLCICICRTLLSTTSTQFHLEFPMTITCNYMYYSTMLQEQAISRYCIPLVWNILDQCCHPSSRICCR